MGGAANTTPANVIAGTVLLDLSEKALSAGQSERVRHSMVMERPRQVRGAPRDAEVYLVVLNDLREHGVVTLVQRVVEHDPLVAEASEA